MIGRGAYAATLDAVIARTGARGAMLLLFRFTEDGLIQVERETHVFRPLTSRLLGVILRDIADELAAPGDGDDPNEPAESGARARGAPPAAGPVKARPR